MIEPTNKAILQEIKEALVPLTLHSTPMSRCRARQIANMSKHATRKVRKFKKVTKPKRVIKTARNRFNKRRKSRRYRK